jgi:hypothetical protein
MGQVLQIPTVYEFLTYPTTNFVLTQKIENYFNKRTVTALAGRVVSTQRMLDYMKNVFGVSRGKNLVFMECYPERFYYQRRLPLLSGLDSQPHIVFIGLDVYENLLQIEGAASKKIHVHIPNVLNGLNGRPVFRNSDFIHLFNKFTYQEITDGTFATFLTQFDACLVTYNFWQASSLSRFNNSIPSRFAIALLAGIPIIVPHGFLKGCEEILHKHQIGFSYENYGDLGDKLNNKKLLAYYQNNATKNMKLFSLENNFMKMDNFLKRIIE